MKRRFQISLKHPEMAKFVLKMFYRYENLPFLDEFKPEAELHKQILTEMIQEGIDSGEFGASANPELAVHVIAGVLMHFLQRQLISQDILLSNELANDIVELLFKGLNE
jgi:hypothetical protein